MKLKHIICIMPLLISVACSDEPEQSPDFNLNANEIKMEAEGGIHEIEVSAPGNWTATASEPWVKVSPVNGVGNQKCVIQVDSSLLANNQREAIVRFTTRDNAESHSISVIQNGFDKSLTLSKSSIELENYAEHGKRYFDIEVTSNVYFEVEIPKEAKPWLSYDKYNFVLDAGARPRKANIRFNWEGNTEMNFREAKVNFKVLDEDLVKHDALLITQDRSPEITPDRAGDSLALVIIERKLNVLLKWDKSESLMNWASVRLWEEQDGCPPEKIGRVRAVEFAQFHTLEGIPDEIRHLTYVETLSFFSNGNKFLQSFDIGTAITELTDLKNLRVFSFGLTTLPDEFKKLNKLVTLDLSGNNFQEVPPVLTPANFPKLRHLSLVNNRRSSIVDLTLPNKYPKEEWGGLYSGKNVLQTLFSWDKLESLLLSNNLIKGKLPLMNSYNQPKYTEADFIGNDTLTVAKNRLMGTPKVLPNCKDLRIGLNYLQGEIPEWILIHPRLMKWSPDVSIFNQNKGMDDNGVMPGFTNVPSSYDYYYELYPLSKPKY